jgi:cytidylate kinase
METKKKVLDQFIKEQVEHLKNKREEMDKNGKSYLPVITVSISPGSLGNKIAHGLATQMKFDLLNREIIREVAKSAHFSSSTIEHLEKERPSGIGDFLASLVKKDYVWPGLYLEHLTKIVHAISQRGHTVIVGRGGNYIIPWDERLAVRTVAPLEKRVENIAQEFDVSLKEAEKRVQRREARRKEFVKKSFNADIDDPLHYDLVLNTGTITTEDAAAAITVLHTKRFSLTQS